MNFRPLIVGLLLVGLFAISLIMGSLQLAALNSPNQTIGNDPAVRSFAASLNSTLEDAYTDANASETAISLSPATVSAGSGGIILDAIGGIWKTMKAAPITIYNLTVGFIFSKLFGSEQYAIVFGILAAILMISVILSVWKLVSTGESG